MPNLSMFGEVPEGFKSGFIAVVGRPNVGKSTLVNSLVGTKVAIISEKPQTTRNRITCVVTDDEYQALFIDTPGIHKPQHQLGEYMNRTALGTVEQVDVVLFMVDGAFLAGRGDQFIAERLAPASTPVVVAVNKVDQVAPDDLDRILQSYRDLGPWDVVVPISALEKQGLGDLLATLVEMLPEGPKYYPDDAITDQPEQFIVAELVREKILHLTREEVPHSVAVIIEEFDDTREGQPIYIGATVYVERNSQKGILIGAGGSMLKEIGQRARGDIQALLGAKVYLDLWVKVEKDWRKRLGAMARFGYRASDE